MAHAAKTDDRNKPKQKGARQANAADERKTERVARSCNEKSIKSLEISWKRPFKSTSSFKKYYFFRVFRFFDIELIMYKQFATCSAVTIFDKDWKQRHRRPRERNSVETRRSSPRRRHGGTRKSVSVRSSDPSISASENRWVHRSLEVSAFCILSRLHQLLVYYSCLKS